MIRIAVLLIFCAAGGLAQPLDPKPFEMVWRADSGVLADLSFLLDAPAGKNGFIRVQSGHLATADGRRVRFWGVNLSMSGSRPRKEDAPAYAAHLARFGVNCVRIHHFDWRTPRGIIDSRRPDSRHLDPEELDRFDFFVAELKKRGIYVNLNLNVGRTFEKEDGVREYDQLGFAKAVTIFDERIIELEKEYAKQLLGHRNPYTGTEYRSEPAIAMVEMINENSLIEYWLAGRLSGKGRAPGSDATWAHIPASYESDLTAKYNDWLKQRLPAADLAKLRQEAGAPEGAPVPRLNPPEFQAASALRFQTEAAFYMHLEDRFFQDMRSYLKDTLGVKSLLVGTSAHNGGISPYPLLASTSKLDIVDAHTYWQHPRTINLPDGRRRQEIANTPMVNEPERSSIVTLSRSAVAGKPFMVSEINHPFPSEYAAEGLPIAAAYGAFLDWDAVFWYSFSHTEPSVWKPSSPGSFDIRQDPVKMTQLAAAAVLFLRGDVSPARRTITRSYSREQVLESLRSPRSEAPYFTPGFPLLLPLRHGSRIASFDGKPVTEFPPVPQGPVVSDTNQLRWQKGLVTVDTEHSQALIGYVKANRPAVRNLAAEIENEFCAILLTSLDTAPIAKAQRLLLTTGARVANEGMKWNEDRKSLASVGTGPVMIEPVTGAVTLRNLSGATGVEAIPLDGAGRAAGTAVQAAKSGAAWKVPLGTAATPWYLLRVTR
jgi:hypothetical protein